MSEQAEPVLVVNAGLASAQGTAPSPGGDPEPGPGPGEDKEDGN